MTFFPVPPPLRVGCVVCPGPSCHPLQWRWGVALLLVLLVVGIGGPGASRAQYRVIGAERLEARCGVHVVPSDTLEAIVRTTAQQDYDITAAPNQGRFVAELLFAVAEQRRARSPDGPPFLIRQKELFPALRRATGLPPEQMPPSAREANRVGLTMAIDYRTDRIINRAETDPKPTQVLSVRATWPDAAGLPDSYTYKDTASVPDVRVEHRRPMTYRLLDYGTVVAYDEMEGVSVEPTSGALGALFSVIGMSDLLESRYAVAEDGTQVTFARVKKLFSMDALATVRPNGRAQRGLPEDRPDLVSLQERVEQELEVTYATPPPPVCPNEAVE